MTDKQTTSQDGGDTGFRIVRRKEAQFGRTERLSTVGLDDVMRDRLSELVEVQGPHAAETSYLYGGNGMSLVTAWFKSGYPVVLHTHNVDCLYYIVAGSLKMGVETLEAGDSFFVPAQVPYTYVAGPEGVELLEFRTAENYDIRFTSSSPAYWDKSFARIKERRDVWENEPRPSRCINVDA